MSGGGELAPRLEWRGTLGGPDAPAFRLGCGEPQAREVVS